MTTQIFNNSPAFGIGVMGNSENKVINFKRGRDRKHDFKLNQNQENKSKQIRLLAEQSIQNIEDEIKISTADIEQSTKDQLALTTYQQKNTQKIPAELQQIITKTNKQGLQVNAAKIVVNETLLKVNRVTSGFKKIFFNNEIVSYFQTISTNLFNYMTGSINTAEEQRQQLVQNANDEEQQIVVYTQNKKNLEQQLTVVNQWKNNNKETEYYNNLKQNLASYIQFQIDNSEESDVKTWLGTKLNELTNYNIENFNTIIEQFSNQKLINETYMENINSRINILEETIKDSIITPLNTYGEKLLQNSEENRKILNESINNFNAINIKKDELVNDLNRNINNAQTQQIEEYKRNIEEKDEQIKILNESNKKFVDIITSNNEDQTQLTRINQTLEEIKKSYNENTKRQEKKIGDLETQIFNENKENVKARLLSESNIQKLNLELINKNSEIGQLNIEKNEFLLRNSNAENINNNNQIFANAIQLYIADQFNKLTQSKDVFERKRINQLIELIV